MTFNNTFADVPVFNAYMPGCEDPNGIAPRTVPLGVDLIAGTWAELDMAQSRLMNGAGKTMQTVYVDNSAGPNDVIMVARSTQQFFTIGAGEARYIPVLTSDGIFLFYSTTAYTLPVQFINVPIQSYARQAAPSAAAFVSLAADGAVITPPSGYRVLIHSLKAIATNNAGLAAAAINTAIIKDGGPAGAAIFSPSFWCVVAPAIQGEQTLVDFQGLYVSAAKDNVIYLDFGTPLTAGAVNITAAISYAKG